MEVGHGKNLRVVVGIKMPETSLAPPFRTSATDCPDVLNSSFLASEFQYGSTPDLT